MNVVVKDSTPKPRNLSQEEFMAFPSHTTCLGGRDEMRVCNLLARIFLLVVVSIWAEAEVARANAQENQQELQLVEATVACGWGERFSVKSGRYSGEEINWLRTILHFRFSGEDIYSIQFEQHADKHVDAREMERLLANPNFVKWIGLSLVQDIRLLIDARANLKFKRHTLPSDPNQFFKHLVVSDYEAAGEKLIETLQQRLGIIVRDNGVDCN